MEHSLIQKIKSLTKRSTPNVLSIGDDTAKFPISPGYEVLSTTDISIEGIHFDLNYFSYYEAGWKAMASNLTQKQTLGPRPSGRRIEGGLAPHGDLRLFTGLSLPADGCQ